MNASILIAEDEPFIVESLTFLLEREGYGVQAVDNGADTVHILEREPPDLLVLDAMMSRPNGFEVLQRLRRMPRGDRVRVLVLTAKGQAGDRDRMLELGADAFVTKPFSNRALLDQIRSLLRGVPGAAP